VTAALLPFSSAANDSDHTALAGKNCQNVIGGNSAHLGLNIWSLLAHKMKKLKDSRQNWCEGLQEERFIQRNIARRLIGFFGLCFSKS